MNLFSVLMLSLSASSDSFVIGFNFGLKGVRIGFISNLYISAVCFLGTCLAMKMGALVGIGIPPALAGLISAGILFALGLWMLRGVRRQQSSHRHGVCTDPETVDRDASKTVELCESLSIGLMLALNNCGIGISAGMAALPVLLTSAVCSGLSFLFIGLGSVLGASMPPGRTAFLLETAAALILMALGLWQATHLFWPVG